MKTNTQLAGALALILAVGALGAMVAGPVEKPINQAEVTPWSSTASVEGASGG